jgi:hypothetical protein
MDEFSDKDEHGDHGESVARKRVPQIRSRRLKRGVDIRYVRDAAESDYRHHDPRRDSQKKQNEKHHDDAGYSKCDSAHEITFLYSIYDE